MARCYHQRGGQGDRPGTRWKPPRRHHTPQLGDLDALEQLSLRMNRLDGDIPRELGKVHTLKEVNLSWNIGVEGVQLLMGKLRRDVASEFVIEQVKRLEGVQLAKLRRLAKLWRDVAFKAVHP